METSNDCCWWLSLLPFPIVILSYNNMITTQTRVQLQNSLLTLNPNSCTICDTKNTLLVYSKKMNKCYLKSKSFKDVLWFEMKRCVWGINKCMRKKNCVRIFSRKYFGHTHATLRPRLKKVICWHLLWWVKRYHFQYFCFT